MDNKNQYIDEIEQFINDTREGKYSDSSCQIQQWQELRYMYRIEEDINENVVGNVILFGLSR